MKSINMNYWIMKSEPSTFSIDHLKNRSNQIEHWDGVRNYQVRNMLRDQMRKNDLAFFYHSNCEIPGIVGTMEIVREGYPDFTAFDPENKHYDPKSYADNPRWYMVDVRFKRKFKHIISLEQLRAIPELHKLQLLRKGNRLSITPISKNEWDIILKVSSF